MRPHTQYLYYQPKWRGRKIVRQLITALTIGSLTLSVYYIFKKNDQGWSRDSVIERRTDGGRRDVVVLATTVFVVSGTSYAIPADCFTITQLDCIGGGGSGGAKTLGSGNGSGGGGGSWARATNVPVTPGSVTIQVGAGGASAVNAVGNAGTDTWFNGANFAASSCGAKAGLGGALSNISAAVTGGAGGAEASNRGGAGGGTLNPGTSFARSGGAGGDLTGSPASSASGGGGAGGSTGNGIAGTNAASPSGAATAGGAGDAGSGGAGSAGTVGATGTAGSAGTEYDATHGSGGASGGCSNGPGAATSGAAGLYGAGTGGAYANGTATTPAGGAGLIVVIYTPFTPLAGSLPEVPFLAGRQYKVATYGPMTAGSSS